VIQCQISGLTASEQQERAALEAEKNRLKKENKQLSEEKEKRRKELGTMARAGAISLGDPFSLELNWWQTSDDDVNTPKTWAGLQEIHKVARAAQDAFAKISDLRELFNHCAVLRMPEEYSKNANDQKKAVEPFYFDARRFAHPLDIGFSLDVQGAETVTHPAVELLALIGLQRFRPGGSDRKWEFEYTVWSKPLSAPVAAAVASGAVPIHPQQRYRFRLLFRDDQRRYKAFSQAIQTGGLINE
jgi:CRISPR-associated protein Csb3